MEAVSNKMPSSSSSTSSERLSFDIYIVEEHNDALEPIYKEIGRRRRLNFSNLTMLHFDSHPDLGLPDTLAADSVYDKHALFDAVAIESWILPAVYAGHISTIVWVKPKWSQQIDCGRYEMRIGKHTPSGLIKCDSRESYFLSENLYCSDLANAKSLLLYVCDFDSVCQESDSFLLDLLKNVSKNELILGNFL